MYGTPLSEIWLSDDSALLTNPRVLVVQSKQDPVRLIITNACGINRGKCALGPEQPTAFQDGQSGKQKMHGAEDDPLLQHGNTYSPRWLKETHLQKKM